MYYMGRSQPPLLMPMVHDYVEVTGDFDLVRDNIDMLEKEFQYWLSNKTIVVNGTTYAMWGDHTTGPRPESYAEDYRTGQRLNGTPEEVEYIYAQLKAGAESGMDYSSRWFIDTDGGNTGSLVDLKVTSIIPVDLNAFLCGNARILSDFYHELGNEAKAALYDGWSTSFYDVVQSLWHEDVGSWLDWDLINNKRRDHFVPSNLVPLWSMCFNRSDSEHISERVLNYMEREELDQFPGGIPNTLERTGEQWDLPNAWAPMQVQIFTIVVQQRFV